MPSFVIYEILVVLVFYELDMKSAAKVIAFWVFIQLHTEYSTAQKSEGASSDSLKFSYLKPVSTGSKKINQLTYENQRVAVLICLSEICMVSRYYAKEMQVLFEKHLADSVFFGGFFPNPFSTDSSILHFSIENHLAFPLFRDSLGAFTQLQTVSTTPEVLVFLNGKKAYQGRFDDFYVAVGRHRGFTRMRFLENAISKALKNELPEKSYITPVGCKIDFRLWDK